MEVILLERVAKLGQMGDVVRVKEGFARNFLLPKGKALRATDENRAKFDSMKSHLQERNLELKGDAQTVASRLDGKSFIVLRQASETGHLFGSVSTRDLATILSDGGFTVNRNQVALNAPIKTIGLHKVPVALHPEIEVTITINIARSADEAARIARGEDVTARGRDEEESAEAVVAAAEAFFENPDDAEKRLSGRDAEEEVPAGEPAPAKS
jgi:large subunit ribosomal protein L9